MTFPFLFRKEIEDQYSQENFSRLMAYAAADAITRCRFEFISINIPGANSDFKWPHSMGFVPLDAIITHNSTGVAVSFNYDKFDSKNISLNCSGATKIRCLVGRYE